MAVSSPHLQESVHFSASFSHGRFTKLVSLSGLNWSPSYRAYMIFYSWLKSFTSIMQQSHLTVLLLKFRAPSVFCLCAVPGWFPGLQLGCSIHFMQSNANKESHASSITNMVMFKCQDAYQPLWSFLTSPSYCSLLWQQWSSCRYMKSYTDSKKWFFFFFQQNGYLTRLTTQTIQCQCQLKTRHRTTLNLLGWSKYETILTGNIPQILIHPATRPLLSSQLCL